MAAKKTVNDAITNEGSSCNPERARPTSEALEKLRENKKNENLKTPKPMTPQTTNPIPHSTTRARAQAMAATGCSIAIIAQRLGITQRHARRLTEGQNIIINKTIGTDQEWRLWEGWYRVHLSYRKVAWRFGVSHEAVRKALQQPSKGCEPLEGSGLTKQQSVTT